MTNVSFVENENVIEDGFTETYEDQLSAVQSLVFTMHVRQPKAHLVDKTGHEVVFNIGFGLAVPGMFTPAKNGESFSTRNSSVDIMKGTTVNFYHIEFDLFPTELIKEPFKTDVGFYGNFAKIYPDKSESRVIPTFCNGTDTWVYWVQSFKFMVTDKHVRCLCSHKMQVKIWDTKDKCAPKVRFDRPKPPKYSTKSKSPNDTVTLIKQNVMIMSKNFSKTASYKDDSERILPHQIATSFSRKRSKETVPQRIKSAVSGGGASTKSDVGSTAVGEVKEKTKEGLAFFVYPKEDQNAQLESYGQLERLIETGSNKNESIERSKTYVISSDKKLEPKEIKQTTKPMRESENISRNESRIVLQQEDCKDYNEFGRTSLEVHLPSLFVADNAVSRISNSFNMIEDLFCMVSTESPILSDSQRISLKPMTVTIRSISGIPCNDGNFLSLRTKYQPLYCEYSFCGATPYRTIQRSHKPKVYMDDVSVILLGDVDGIKLKNQIVNSFFTINLFDRIPKKEKENFDNNMRSIGDVNITSNIATTGEEESIFATGEANIDLSDLVKKKLKYLEAMVPIVPASLFDSNSNNNDNKSGNSSNKIFDSQLNYLEYETSVRVTFHLAERLSIECHNNETDDENNYNRVAIVSRDMSCSYIRKDISDFIVEYNCRELQFKDRDLNNRKTFLYSCSSSSLDKKNILRGFFIVDGEMEVLVVEGTVSRMREFYSECSKLMDNYQISYGSQLKLLYDESVVFPLDDNFQLLSMIPLILSKKLSFFASQPLLYVRDILPRSCVDGICKLTSLVGTDSMKIVIRNNLIPSGEMIKSISEYLCSYIIDNNREVTMVNDKEKISRREKIDRRIKVKTAPLLVKGDRKASKVMKRSKTGAPVRYITADFSYSSQSKNSTQIALKEIRELMNPKRRYTYANDYLFSGNVDPDDIQDVYVNEERSKRSEPRWQTASEKRIVDLPESRKDELKETWIENVLHHNMLQPTLPERDIIPNNFDLYIRPLRVIERQSISLISSCSSPQDSKDFTQSLDSMENIKIHRMLSQTELTNQGLKSSNQLDRLRGLRKDNLQMKGFIGRQFSDPNLIPALNCVLSNYAESSLAYTLGGLDNRNLLVNYVPVSQKDPNFKSVYQPSADSFLYKNQKPKIRNVPNSPFLLST